VSSPDGLEGSETSGCFDIPDYTNSDHWWGFNNGDGFDNVLLVEFGSLSFQSSDDVGHASFETDKSGQMRFFGFVVFGVGLDSP